MDIKSQNHKRNGSNKGYKKKKSLKKARNKTFNYNNNQDYNSNFTSSISSSKKNLDEMMKDYKRFVKKFFGNINSKDYISQERINEILEEKDNIVLDQNVILQNQKNYLIYEKLLKNSKDYDFNDEEIEVQMPSSDEIAYSLENRLGKNKNNEKDYNKRKKQYEKTEIDNEILDENKNNTNPEENKEEEKEKDIEDKKEEEKDIEDKEDKGDKEEEEEKEVEEDKVHENIRHDSKSPICEDYDTRKDKEIKAKKIQVFFREKKSKERLYVGMDKSRCNIIRMYVGEYDQNQKIKSIKVFIYLLLDKESLVLEKSIKELLKRDSISKKSLMKCMNEVIEKILVRKEDTINLDLVSETAKSKGIINNSKKEEEIFIVKKKNVNKNEEDKKEDNKEDKKEDNKEDKKKDEKEKEDSLIGDADYDF